MKLLVIGYLLFVVGYLLLVICYWLFVIGQYGSLNTIYAPEIPLASPLRRGTLRAFLSPPSLRGVRGDQS